MTPAPKRRKQPSQARSRETVAVILQAAIQVFSKRGYAGTTTTRIAERAGVSVGTLYQYFPNKDAVLVALWEQHAQEAHAKLREVLLDPALVELPIRTIMRRLSRAMVDLHLQNPRLHQVLSEELPKRGVAAQAKAKAEAELLEQTVRLFEAHPRLQLKKPARAALFVGQLLESFSHWYVLQAPALEQTPEAFAEELAQLATSYLRRA